MQKICYCIIIMFVYLYPLTASGEVVFSDDFEYSAPRTAGGADAFHSTGGWDVVKAENATDGSNTINGGSGFLWTATTSDIPGHVGSFPGADSSRVLCIEAKPETYGTQTAFHLQLGSTDGNHHYIPADVWFQFWIYVARSGSQMSRIGTRDKFLYPCNTSTGVGSCNTNKWLMETGAMSYNPYNTAPFGSPSEGYVFFNSRDNMVGTPYYSLAEVGDENKLGQTNIDKYVSPNTWFLVKMHYNTGSTSGNSWEAWLREQDESEFTKVAEWIGGVTPNFTWDIPAEHATGHLWMAMPTTVPGPNTTPCCDYWIYLDDFYIATSESDLPIYGGSTPSTPTIPGGVTISGGVVR